MQYTIHIISDGTGRTANQIVKAALVQFENVNADIIIHNNIRKEEELLQVFESIETKECMIVHTIVSNNLRNKLIDLGKVFKFKLIDLMGPLLSQMSSHFSSNPIQKPGVFNELNKAYFQRIDAIEFAIKHDDGQRADELHLGDIVLIGISRTFKTPLSIYLANLGWKTGNYPLVMDYELDPAISKIPPEKVFFLNTDPERLSTLRKERDKYLGGNVGPYSQLDFVRKELHFANMILEKHRRWNEIVVTDKPLEEIASNIISIIKKSYVTDFNKS